MWPHNYASTRNKERVREEDTKLIKKEYFRKERKLTYLGMPSGEMRDILAWQNFFERCTAVEIESDSRNELVLNTIRNNLSDKVKILFGDIQEILIKGEDNFKNKLEFPYDIVFLDFFGTIIYKGLRRVEAIENLIKKQKGNSFLFLLTFNIKERRYCKNEVNSVFDKIQKHISSFFITSKEAKEEIQNIIAGYKAKETHEMYRQKLFVPYFIKTFAEATGFKTHCYAPIFYLGYSRSPMIHFAFKLSYEPYSSTKAISDQSLIDIVNINIKKATKGRISVMREQMPHL